MVVGDRRPSVQSKDMKPTARAGEKWVKDNCQRDGVGIKTLKF
jgi:hypothetical protein